jgi:hypothetical protein
MSGIIGSAGSKSGVIDRSNISIGFFTRNIDAVSSTIAYTGVGFRPSAVIFNAVNDDLLGISWGFDDTSGTNQVIHYRPSIPDYRGNQHVNNASIRIVQNDNAGYGSIGEISALSSDGFSITWTRLHDSTLAGPIIVTYMAFR